MVIEVIVAAGAVGAGGVVAAWQYILARRRRDVESNPIATQGPYRHQQTPPASVDDTTGGFPMPPSFEDGWTPKQDVPPKV
jgi:hypothetical protein